MTIKTLLALTTMLLLSACESSTANKGTPVSSAELNNRIQDGSAPAILDVRTPEEFANGQIPGAVNIPFDELASQADNLPFSPTDEIVVYCRSGRRASLAKETLSGLGFSNIRDLSGHWQEWQASKLPTSSVGG
jgi:phage shock protein E